MYIHVDEKSVNKGGEYFLREVQGFFVYYWILILKQWGYVEGKISKKQYEVEDIKPALAASISFHMAGFEEIVGTKNFMGH